MESDEADALCAISISAFCLLQNDAKTVKKKRKTRSEWTKQWLQRRDLKSLYLNLVTELRTEEVAIYTNYLRMRPEDFDFLLSLIRADIAKEDTVMREAISPEIKLVVTIRYLATGSSYDDLACQYRVHKSTICLFIPEVCDAIYKRLKDEYLRVPSKREEWLEIAKGFEDKWNFPNCIGALDGKHVKVRCPPKSGSYYFNYKGTFSVVLMALVDHDYKFIYVDAGCNGRIGDSGVFRNSSLCRSLEDNSLNIPEPRMLDDQQTIVPYTIVGDDAFPLRPYIMKPYAARNLTSAERIFNYRLSRARRIVENAFGILASRFRIFLSTIQAKPEVVEKVVLASCALHNYLRTNCSRYLPSTSVDREEIHGVVIGGDWRNDEGVLTSLSAQGTNSYSREAKEVRQKYCEYFNNYGQVPWQNNYI